MAGLDKAIEKCRVIVVCGPGGVGKTTCSAAIAYRLAMQGKKVAVLTVDPARRLADSLGLETLGNVPSRIEHSRFAAQGGELWAMMLDSRSAYDEMVSRYARNEEQKQRILNNPFYQHFTQAVGGSHEYAAMEKIYDLSCNGGYDIVILDTPPSLHALDLLQAPQRMMDVVDESIFKWVIKPYLAAGKLSVQVLSFGSAYILKILTRFIGGEMLSDIADFLGSFQGMFGDFHKRAESVQKLLHDPNTAFLVVSSPSPASMREAAAFQRELERAAYNFNGFIVNRSLYDENCLVDLSSLDFSELFRSAGYPEEMISSVFGNKLKDNWKIYNHISKKFKQENQQLEKSTGKQAALVQIPLFERDIHDIESLMEFAALLWD